MAGYTITEDEGCFEVHDDSGRECWVASTRAGAEEWIAAEREGKVRCWPRPRAAEEDYQSRLASR